VAFDGGGAGTVVADDAALVLHHRERGTKVRSGPRKMRRGAASGALSGRTAAASQGKSGREVAACLSADEKERGRKGEQDGGQRLLWRLGGAGGEKRGQAGSGVRRRTEGKWGRERGPGHGGGGGQPGGRRRPLDDGCGQWGYGATGTGASDPVRARLTDGARRRRGAVASGWVREGVRGSEAAAASGR
jgi:hypothetical protein